MSKIRRLDSVGTRRNSAGTEVANFCDKEQFVRMYIYLDDAETGATLKKGSTVSLEYRTDGTKLAHVLVEGVATLARTEFGFGNVCKLSDTADDNMELFAFGILAEDVTLASGGFAIVDVQVAGLFENAIHVDAGAEGARLFASSTAGALTDPSGADFDASGPCVAVQLEEASTDAAGDYRADVYLLDPFNLAE